jgi:hypothetical protein
MNFIRKSTLISLGAVLALSLLIVSASNKLILTQSFFAESGHALAALPGQDMLLFAGLQKWIYVLAGLYLLFKVCLVSLILYTALYIADHHTPYSQVLQVVTLCETVFLIAAVIKIIWFHWFYPHGSLLDWHRFYILSALSFFNTIPADWYYPLQTLNAFEVLYWLFLAYGIARVTRLKYSLSFQIILFSYVPALIIWMVVVCFCTIMYFPDHG